MRRKHCALRRGSATSHAGRPTGSQSAPDRCTTPHRLWPLGNRSYGRKLCANNVNELFDISWQLRDHEKSAWSDSWVPHGPQTHTRPRATMHHPRHPGGCFCARKICAPIFENIIFIKCLKSRYRNHPRSCANSQKQPHSDLPKPHRDFWSEIGFSADTPTRLTTQMHALKRIPNFERLVLEG